MTEPEQPLPEEQVEERRDTFVWEPGDVEVEEDDDDDRAS